MLDRTDAVVRVGSGGRGFIIEVGQRRYVITAAHCLPRLPPAHSGAYTVERTFRRLLGPLSMRRRTVWAQCVFVDPVADIAVLSEPDGQELFNEHEAYEALTASVEPFLLGTLTFVQQERRLPNGNIITREAEARGQMLSLCARRADVPADRRWFACMVKSYGGRAAAVEQPEAPIEFGMSGVPDPRARRSCHRRSEWG